MAGEQVPQGLGADPSAIQRGVEAAPAATVRSLEAQMDGRRNGVGGEDGIGELEEGVCPAMEDPYNERRKARRASRGSMMRPSCPQRGPCASFAASGVKTQA